MYLTIIFLPILGSFVSGLLGRKVGVQGAQIITTTCLIISTILNIIIFYEVGLSNSSVQIEITNWIDLEIMKVN